MKWPGGNADRHVGALLASTSLGHHGKNEVGQPPPSTVPTVPYVRCAVSVAIPKWIAQTHRAVQEVSSAKVTAFGGGGGKGGKTRGVQHLWAHPRDGPVLQVTEESDVGGK